MVFLSFKEYWTIVGIMGTQNSLNPCTIRHRMINMQFLVQKIPKQGHSASSL